MTAPSNPNDSHTISQPATKHWRKATAAFIALIIFLFTPATWILLSTLDQVTESTDVSTTHPVTLVLGAGIRPSGVPSSFLAKRLDIAVDLYVKERTEVIVVSGDNRRKNYDEPTAMKRYLVQRGVPANRIVTDFAGRDTYDSCFRLKEIFGVDAAFIVSQTFHLPRAVRLCRSLGVNATGVGDSTMKAKTPKRWYVNTIREIPAAHKAVWDILSGRPPILGKKETSVRDALQTPRK